MSASLPISAAELYFADDRAARNRATWHAGRRLRDGTGVFAWSGEAGDAAELAVTDDTGCVHFSYWLSGGASYRLDGGRVEEAKTRTGIVGHAPAHEAWFRRHGPYANVVVLMSPQDLLELPGSADGSLRRDIAAGFCYRDGYRGGALHDAALALYGGLRGAAGLPAHPLWLQAKSLEFVALFLDGQRADAAALPAADRRRLLAARDRLLTDLADPPTIAQLARECGLNALKLKRGFKQLFGTGVFGLFQRERMHAARRLLERGDCGVAQAAAAYGYANASHFAAAFRREFGVAPAAVKRGAHVPGND